ncbi:MAG TPA: hypothetical protein PLA71_00210 [Saccharofermentans sp.]|nr:hypothetical protein [Saccharofermentans sp.]
MNSQVKIFRFVVTTELNIEKMEEKIHEWVTEVTTDPGFPADHRLQIENVVPGYTYQAPRTRRRAVQDIVMKQLVYVFYRIVPDETKSIDFIYDILETIAQQLESINNNTITLDERLLENTAAIVAVSGAVYGVDQTLVNTNVELGNIDTTLGAIKTTLEVNGDTYLALNNIADKIENHA